MWTCKGPTYYLRSWIKIILKWYFYFKIFSFYLLRIFAHLKLLYYSRMCIEKDQNNQIVPISRFLSTFDEWASYLGCVSGHLVFAWLESVPRFFAWYISTHLKNMCNAEAVLLVCTSSWSMKADHFQLRILARTFLGINYFDFFKYKNLLLGSLILM